MAELADYLDLTVGQARHQFRELTGHPEIIATRLQEQHEPAPSVARIRAIVGVDTTAPEP